MLFSLTHYQRIAKLARLMAPDLQFIDPLLLIEQCEKLTGQIPLDSMRRLHEVIAEITGKVDYNLEFGKDAQGINCIGGDYRVDLQMYCQRCLNPVLVRLAENISIGIVTNREQANSLPGQYEPVIHNRGLLSLVMLLEEEILLSMPMVPVHGVDECPSSRFLEELKPDWDNPFKVLQDLKLK